MCSSLNRTGELCGDCLEGNYPPSYSYSTKCVYCNNVGLNWLTYISVAYFPLTLFYIIVVFFKINTTSSHLFPVVFYCQTIVNPIVMRFLLHALQKRSKDTVYLLAKILISAYGIWNLDFFRPYYTDLCLGINVLHTLALDYIVAVYPFILTVISYLLVLLYNRNYGVVTAMWRPFRCELSSSI